LEPKIKVEICELEAEREAVSQNPHLNRTKTPAERPMEDDLAAKTEKFLDPDYPSREVLLEVAEKLLQMFEKR